MRGGPLSGATLPSCLSVMKKPEHPRPRCRVAPRHAAPPSIPPSFSFLPTSLSLTLCAHPALVSQPPTPARILSFRAFSTPDAALLNPIRAVVFPALAAFSKRELRNSTRTPIKINNETCRATKTHSRALRRDECCFE